MVTLDFSFLYSVCNSVMASFKLAAADTVIVTSGSFACSLDAESSFLLHPITEKSIASTKIVVVIIFLFFIL
ncbi:hypothetical protein D3C73_747340 [compost metagenome]